jgi:nucleoside-diphosphate-sugar epimerase
MRILVTGGAGYVGSVLLPMLLKGGHHVTVLDTFTWGVEPILHCASDPSLQLAVGDIRNPSVVRSAMRGADAAIHLAAIVGYPACDADPEGAKSTNVLGTRNVAAAVEGRPLVFASTCSVYGKVRDMCDEYSPPRPLTLYATTKLQAETIVADAGGVILRFATLFGVAPRLRLDLLVNQFVYQAVRHGKLTIYESHFRRTFLHVRDAARSCSIALELVDRMAGRPFNVADERANMTKMEVAEKILEHVAYELRRAEIGSDQDQRDYEVSVRRITELGFVPESTLEQGIRELLTVLALLRWPDDPACENSRGEVRQVPGSVLSRPV